MSTKQPTGMFPSVQQLQSGDVSFPIKNKSLIEEGRHFEGLANATTDPVAGDAKDDKNKAIVEKTAEELAKQYAGVYKPSF